MSTKYSSGHVPHIYERARQLRKQMTSAERILWKQLRNRRFAEFKFRRQQPLDDYIADFFCAAVRLVIELDGDSHMGQAERDAVRQAYIESHDIRVIRFWNSEVYDELEWVLDSIAWALEARTTRQQVPVFPSPLAGEGGGASPPGEG